MAAAAPHDQVAQSQVACSDWVAHTRALRSAGQSRLAHRPAARSRSAWSEGASQNRLETSHTREGRSQQVGQSQEGYSPPAAHTQAAHTQAGHTQAAHTQAGHTQAGHTRAGYTREARSPQGEASLATGSGQMAARVEGRGTWGAGCRLGSEKVACMRRVVASEPAAEGQQVRAALRRSQGSRPPAAAQQAAAQQTARQQEAPRAAV